MDASERVNLPAWRGQAGHYEIWFVVVFDRDRERATWVRYTTFAPDNGSPAKAMVWAADFDVSRNPSTIWAKAHHAISDYKATTDTFSVTIGDAFIKHGHCAGRVRAGTTDIGWQFDYQMGTAPVRRTPAVLEQVKLATEAVHACSDAPTTGFVEVNGVRHDIERGTAVQMHLHGTRRLDELSWIWAPELDNRVPYVGEPKQWPSTTVEVVSARGKTGFSLRPFSSPRMTSLFFRHQDQVEDLTQFPDAVRSTVAHPGPGILEVAHTSVLRATRVRSFAPLDTFAAWAYRNPSGNDLFVAQSDIASCVVESFRRRHPFAPWQPVGLVSTARRSALELHGTKAIDGLPYVGWEETSPPHGVSRSKRATPMAPSGHIAALPTANDVIGAGTTFRETATDAGIYVFRKGVDSLRAAATAFGERRIATPSQTELRERLDKCEAGLGAIVAQRYSYLPLLLDYEVELVMIVTAPITVAELRSGMPPTVGWALGNDLTSRSVQCLAEGKPNRMDFWSASKSFANFLPLCNAMWVPPSPVDAVPDVRLRTWVNGDIRQDTEASQMFVKPSEILIAAAGLLGRSLTVGDYVMCGTPAGLALKVPQWRRKLATIRDRFGKLDAAIKMYVEGAGFLRYGDVVEVDAGFVGNDRVRIDLE
jgi:2-keto-4-pentenoate hydratase/2-oxohepta-3-ene-1,7-dioic acid hydratase in catechol pathway